VGYSCEIERERLWQLQNGSRTPGSTIYTLLIPHGFDWPTLHQRSESNHAPEDANGGVHRKLAISWYDGIEVLICCRAKTEPANILTIVSRILLTTGKLGARMGKAVRHVMLHTVASCVVCIAKHERLMTPFLSCPCQEF